MAMGKLIKLTLLSVLCTILATDSGSASGDRNGWRHYKDEGSRYEVFSDFDGAERAYTKSLRLATASAATAAERAEVIARLANSMILQGKFEKAQPFFEELLKLIPSLKTAGKGNEDFFTCVDSLSAAYFEKPQGARRISGIQHSIRLIDTAFGDKHPRLLSYLIALSSVYSALGMNQEGLAFATRAVALAGKDNSDKGKLMQVKALAMVGNCQQSSGDWNNALGTFEKSMSLIDLVARKKYSITVGSIKAHLSMIYWHLGKKAESKRLLEEAERIYLTKIEYYDRNKKKDLGSGGPDLLPLAQIYVAHNQYAKAEPICARSIVWTKVALGPRDAHLINEFRLHGYILSRLGRMTQAAQQESLAIELAKEYKLGH